MKETYKPVQLDYCQKTAHNITYSHNYDGETRGMRFVLTYFGPLPPNGNNQEKHRIRQVLLPQLRRQWDIDPYLHVIAHSGSQNNPGAGTRLNDIANQFTKGGFSFVPLVLKEFNLVCNLQIVMLRNEEPGNLIQTGGDIDNRLKTLFDSLSVPPHENQLTGLVPAANENPFFCLLEDDSLVTGIEVKTERLLELHGNATDVRLTMTAIVRPTKVTLDSLGFLGGWM
jgi:hypothetical protein